MKTFTGIFALGIILLFASCQTEEKPNTLTKKEIKEGWELLFDGKSLDNWKTFNGGKVTGWKIEDGVFTIQVLALTTVAILLPKRNLPILNCTSNGRLRPKVIQAFFTTFRKGSPMPFTNRVLSTN